MKARNVFTLFLLMVIFLRIDKLIAAQASAESGSTLVSQPEAWRIETIQSGLGLNTGLFSSLAYTDSGVPFISYYNQTDEDLMVASLIGSGGNCGANNRWFCRALDRDGDVGRFSSIDIQSGAGAQHIGIAYYDATRQALKYVDGICTTMCYWSITIIEQPGNLLDAGSYATLKFDLAGKAHIVYVVNSAGPVPSEKASELRQAYFTGAGGNCGNAKWNCTTIAKSPPGEGDDFLYPSLDVSRLGAFRIAYHYAGALYYGSSDVPGVWNLQMIQEEAGDFAALHLAMSAAENPMIASYDPVLGRIQIAGPGISGSRCGTAQAWKCAGIDDIGAGLVQAGVSLTDDRQGFPVIAYMDASNPAGNAALKVARPVSALGSQGGNCGPQVNARYSWVCAAVDNPPVSTRRAGLFASIGAKPSGIIGVAYYEYNTQTGAGSLKYAELLPTIWIPWVSKNN